MTAPKFQYGDILLDDADVLCVPVNCYGVMGAGLAKQVRDDPRFQFVMLPYANLCSRSNPLRLITGEVRFVVGAVAHVPAVALCATKDHWKHPTAATWVLTALVNLARWIRSGAAVPNRRAAQAVAVPALGCGLGGLRWIEVQPLFIDLWRVGAEHNIDVRLYPPQV